MTETKKSSNNNNSSFTLTAIVGKELYNFSLEPLKFPNNTTPIKKPETHLNLRYIFQPPEPPIPLILSYQNVNRFFYKTQNTSTSAKVYYYNSDHLCVLNQETMRCKQCGISLKWQIMADTFIMKMHQISTFEYERLEILNDFFFFKEIQNFSTLRKFISFVLDRQIGQGFEDLYNRNLQFPSEVFNELGGLNRLQNMNSEPLKLIADFENSNVKAFKVSKESKDGFNIKLMMRGDTNFKQNEYSQWFFFKIIAKKPISINFEILNYQNKNKFIEKNVPNGMVFYDIEEGGVNKTWKFMTDGVKYTKEKAIDSKKTDEIINNWQTLKFSYSFDNPKEVLFATSFPYTFTNLLDFLSKQEKKLFAKGIKEQEFDYQTKEILLENEQISYNRKVLGSSVCGLPLILLQITSSKYQDPDLYFPAKHKEKKVIIIFSRQHANEAPSSHFVEAIIAYLLSEEQSAQILRTFFVFIIIPMINPDGVVLGNHRTNFKGVDLYEKWKSPNIETEPEIANIKHFIEEIVSENKKNIFMFLDLHSHSHKKGFFIDSAPTSSMREWEMSDDCLVEWAKSLFLTNILEKTCRYLNLANCTNEIATNEENAKGLFAKEYQVPFCYKIQTSMLFYQEKQSGAVKHFKIEDFKVLAKDLMLGILDLTTLIADIEYGKCLRNRSETDDLHFNKYLVKVRKMFPEFKESWRSYFSELQFQDLYQDFSDFLELLNETLFPKDKDSPSKGLEPNVASEKMMREFCENILLEKKEKNKNEDSFSSYNDDNNEHLEQSKEKNKRILAMMLFHETDLKRTEKMLKKKATKKTLIDKQNNSASIKRNSMLGQLNPLINSKMSPNKNNIKTNENKNIQLKESYEKTLENENFNLEIPKNKNAYEETRKTNFKNNFIEKYERTPGEKNSIEKNLLKRIPLETSVNIREDKKIKDHSFEKIQKTKKLTKPTTANPNNIFTEKQPRYVTPNKNIQIQAKNQVKTLHASSNMKIKEKPINITTPKYAENLIQKNQFLIKNQEEFTEETEYFNNNGNAQMVNSKKIYDSPNNHVYVPQNQYYHREMEKNLSADEKFVSGIENFEKDSIQNEKDYAQNKNSWLISTGATATSTPFAAQSALFSGSSTVNKKIQNFFEETNPNSQQLKENYANNMEENNTLQNNNSNKIENVKDRSNINMISNSNYINNNNSNTRKLHSPSYLPNSDILEKEELYEWQDKRNSWSNSQNFRPKTTGDDRKLVVYNYNEFQNSDKKFQRSCRKSQYSHDYNREISEFNPEKIESIKNYFFHLTNKSDITKNNRISFLNSSDRLSNSRNLKKRKFIVNPFIKSKKEIYENYSFIKPVILLKNKHKWSQETFANSTITKRNTLEGKSQANFCSSLISENFDETKKNENNVKYRAFHLVKKKFL